MDCVEGGGELRAAGLPGDFSTEGGGGANAGENVHGWRRREEGGGRREEGRREGGRRRGKEGKQKAEGKQKGGGMELKKRSTTPRYVQRSFVEQGGDPLDPPLSLRGPSGRPLQGATSAPSVPWRTLGAQCQQVPTA